MQHYTSFEKYLEDNYYNDIFEKLESFIKGRGSQNGFYSYTVLDPDDYELDDIKVMGVTFDKSEGNKIYFNASILASVILKGLGKRDYEADQKNAWYTVSFVGYLLGGLNLVTIVKVDDYSQRKFSEEDSLSRYLVPYLYAKNLDREAEAFLEMYYPEALEKPMALDMDTLLENMALTKRYAPLPNNIFGMTYFDGADIEVCDRNGDNPHSETIEPGTVLINPDVSFMRNVGSENNTVVHECVHWDRHSKFFELQKLLNDDLRAIRCETVEEYSHTTKDIDKALKWMEWQANALAPRILMPARTTKEKLNEILKRQRKQWPDVRHAVIMEMAIMELANFFDVSFFAAKLRAIDLGFDEAEGTQVYVDGKYHVPFSFKRGSLKKNQTFIVDPKNALVESNMNPELSELVHFGAITYANCMFVINDPKYVTKNEKGSLALTDYALDHVDECCLIFERKTRVSDKYDDSFYRQCFLCRDIDSSHLVETKYDPDQVSNQNKAERAREIQKSKNAMAEIAKHLNKVPGLFNEALAYHMKRKGLTDEELEGRCKISSRQIGDYRRKPDLNITLESVMALCIGMNLQTYYCEDLISKAGHTLRLTERDMVYRELIEHHTDENIDMWNETLADFGLEQRLPSKRK